MRVGRDRLARGGAEPRPQLRLVVHPPQRRAERVRVARGDDEPGALVADEPAGDGADGIGGDHGNSLVEGFVDHQPPRLEEVAGGDRRYDHNVASRVVVADFGRRARPYGQDRAGGDGPGSDRTAADQNQRGA